MKSYRIALTCGAALMLPAASAALAQANYPAKPVRWIVPYAPGGGTDLLARTVAAKFTEAWGKQVIVENRPGGATNIGTEVAAKSAPDGYTLFASTLANAINTTLFPRLNYDIVRDFSHITNIAKLPSMIVVHPTVPAKNAKELVALAKARPNKLSHGSPGIGSPQHLGAEMFKSMTGVRMVHVPYKGASPALIDVVGGHIEVYFGNVVSTLPYAKNGRLRALGVTSLKRIDAAPEIPSLNEQGFKGFEVVSWVLVSIPAGTPREIVMKIHGDAVRAIRMPDVRERLASDGAELVGDTPEQVTAYLKAEIEKWGKAVKSSGAKPEG
jgi:tripartite-type tricarboxylate transporter receptor subunit TctC